MRKIGRKITPFLLSIIVAVIIVALSILSIPQKARSVATYLLIGIFVSGGIIGWKRENKRNAIISNLVLWSGIIVAIVITLI